MRSALLPVLLALVLAGCTSSQASDLTDDPGPGSDPPLAAATGPAGALGDDLDDDLDELATHRPGLGAALGVTEFARAVERPGTVVLDVRPRPEHQALHLPEAINVDATADDFAERITYLDPEVPYALYDAGGQHAEIAVQEMVEAGFTDVYHLTGGISAWEQAGLSLVGER